MFILFPFLLFGLLGPDISNQDQLHTMLPCGEDVMGFLTAAEWQQETAHSHTVAATVSLMTAGPSPSYCHSKVAVELLDRRASFPL